LSESPLSSITLASFSDTNSTTLKCLEGEEIKKRKWGVTSLGAGRRKSNFLTETRDLLKEELEGKGQWETMERKARADFENYLSSSLQSCVGSSPKKRNNFIFLGWLASSEISEVAFDKFNELRS
jgi:hypothetical protein